jgi:hypothetical protein
MSKKTQQSVFTYGIVEASLAEVLEIEPGDMKAFKGRVRHLRNLGLPSGLPKPGSGKSISYSLDQVSEMLFALALERTGYTPRAAVSMAPGVLKGLKDQQDLAHINPKEPGDTYVVIKGGGGEAEDRNLNLFLSAKGGWGFVTGRETLTNQLKEQWLEENDTLVIINVSRLVRVMEKSLMKGLWS